MSRIIDYTDRATCVLFGDGAGAMLIESAGENDQAAGYVDFLGEVDGSGGDYLKMPAGGSRMPPSHETVDQRLHYVHQDGSQVFKYAVRKMYEVCSELLDRNGLTTKDVAILIPHQANGRIIAAAAERLDLEDESLPLQAARQVDHVEDLATVYFQHRHRRGERRERLPPTRRTRSGSGGGAPWRREGGGGACYSFPSRIRASRPEMWRQ